MREKLLAANKIVEQHRADRPDEPETFSKIYRRQHLAEQVDAILKESFVIQKLVERFSFETTLKRIRLVLPEISEEEGQRIAKQKEGFSQAMSRKVMGKASNRLKYAHSDYLDKAEGIAQLEASIEENLKLMKEVSLLVFRQGEMIGDVLKNVEKAKDYVKKGEAVLEVEKEKHKKSRKVSNGLCRKCAASSSSGCSSSPSSPRPSSSHRSRRPTPTPTPPPIPATPAAATRSTPRSS